MNYKELRIRYREYTDLADLNSEDQQLLTQAHDVAEQAYSPYSEFRVGAAVLLNNNTIVTGSNQENAAYPSGLCAERVALFYANSKYPDQSVKKIAIVAFNREGLLEDPVPPCGACRQVMLETEQRYKQDMEVILQGKKAIYVFESGKVLLPFSFDANYLNK